MRQELRPDQNKDGPSRSSPSRDDRSGHRRSPSRPSYSLTTWTGAAYADNRVLYICVGAAAVLAGSIALALWLVR
jgi:hypothetical protein